MTSFLFCCCSTIPPRSTPLPSPPPPPPPAPIPQRAPKEQAAEPPPTSPQPPPAVVAESARKALLGVDLAFSRASEERGAPEAFYDFMAPDGVGLLDGEAPIEGRDAIKVHFSAFSPGSISWKPRDSEVSATLDMGYTWGTYQFHAQDKSKPSTGGKYVIVWKKLDGAWKASVFITSPGPSGPPSP